MAYNHGPCEVKMCVSRTDAIDRSLEWNCDERRSFLHANFLLRHRGRAMARSGVFLKLAPTRELPPLSQRYKNHI